MNNDDNNEVTPEELQEVSTEWIGRVKKSGGKITRNALRIELARMEKEAAERREAQAEAIRKREEEALKQTLRYQLVHEVWPRVKKLTIAFAITAITSAFAAATAWWNGLF